MINSGIPSRKEEYDEVVVFSQLYGIYIVRKNNKWGVIRVHNDESTEIALPIEYDEIKIWFKNIYLLLAVKEGRKRLVKTTLKRTFISPFYDKVGRYRSSIGLMQVSIGDFVGAVDKDLKEVIPIHYDIMDDSFHIVNIKIGMWGRLALVMKKDGKYGILKITGETLLPFDYDEIDEGFIYRIQGKNNNGWRKWQVERYEDHTSVGYINHLEGAQISGSGLIPVKKFGFWGLVDENHFEEITPCIYLSIQQKTYDKIILFKEAGHDLLIPTKDGYRIESVTTVNLDQYSEIGEFEDGLAPVQKDGKFGFVNEEYKEVVPCIYDVVGPFIHGISIVSIGDKNGAINNEGKIAIPLEYSILLDISLFGPTLLMAVKNNRFGVVDKANKIIVPFDFDLVQAMFGMITVTKNGKKGLYNHKGELVLPIKYDDIAQPSAKSQTYAVCIAGKWGVVNKKEEIIIPIEYDGVSHISSGCMYSVCKAGKWGIINKNGENITPFIYDKIDKDGFGFTCGRLSVCKNGKWGFINRNGREVIDCIYDDVIQFFEENRSEVMFNGMKITIDIYGNQI